MTLTIAEHTDPKYPCRQCGAPCWPGHHPVVRPNGDVLRFAVCPSCWLDQEFVNDKPATVVFVPVGRGTGG